MLLPPEHAPKTVATLLLCQNICYDGVIHRIIKDFIQGGDPTGTGMWW